MIRNQGISDELLNSTDVLVWWGHKRHGDVKDELVSKIEKRVKEDGMGFIGTHSAHFSKPLKKFNGDSVQLE
jgi:trehalose utilization protein